MLSFFGRNTAQVSPLPYVTQPAPAEKIDLIPFAILIEGVCAMNRPPASRFDRQNNQAGRRLFA